MSIFIRFGNRYRHLFERSLGANRRFIKRLRPITLTSKQYVPICPYTDKYNYDTKNMMMRRPLSPHLEIYRKSFNMVTSMMHRVTGALMATYMMTLGLSALLCPSFPRFLMTCNMPLLLHIIVKAAIAGPICYHYFSGIRKLAWCWGKYLTKREITMTGYVMIGVASFVMFVLVFLV